MAVVLLFAHTLIHSNEYWTEPETWGNKTVAVEPDKFYGLMLEAPTTGNTSSTYQVVEANANTIKVNGVFNPAYVGEPFRLFYGALIKNKIDTPDSGLQDVKYFNPKDPLTGSQSTDLCQVCHVNTVLPSDVDHTFQAPCTTCHAMSEGFAPN